MKLLKWSMAPPLIAIKQHLAWFGEKLSVPAAANRRATRMKSTNLFVVLVCLASTVATSQAGDDKFGIPLKADGKSNLRVGRWDGQVSYRIKALRSGSLTGFTYASRFNDPGSEAYSKGNGGEFTVRLVADDGTQDHLPDENTVLASVTFTFTEDPGDLVYYADSSHRQVDFDEPYDIEEGQLYHLWFENIDTDQANHFSSVNDLVQIESGIPSQPAYDDLDLAVLFRWYPNSWDHLEHHTAFYTLHFADGGSQSQGYGDAWSQSGDHPVEGESEVRQVIENVKEGFIANKIHVALRKFNDPGLLRITIEESDGSNSQTIDISSNSINSTGCETEPNCGVDWTSNGSVSYTFEASKDYHIEFSAPNATSGNYYEFFPLQEYVTTGISGTLVNGYADLKETDSGGWKDGWLRGSSSTPRQDGDLMVYFEGDPDCNANDVADSTDISGDTSADCNSNCIPDECEIAQGTSGDCNSNGIPDSCDIASGTSDDCDTNGVPDVCDPPDYFDDFEAYDTGTTGIPGWVDTESNSSLVVDDSLFDIASFGGTNGVLHTSNTLTNIHAHRTPCGSEGWSSFEYTGKMRFSNSSGGIGVTFLSGFPDEAVYHRLRRTKFGTDTKFHISPSNAGTNTLEGTTSTGVEAYSNTWYNFKIQVTNTTSQTTIKAKVWDGLTEPGTWQADCYDDGGTYDRLTEGTFGVWSMDQGDKYWDDLKVTPIP